MRRANEFIQIYNTVADHLRTLTEANSEVSFSALVDQGCSKHIFTRETAGRLKDYANLRNAIVHHRSYPGVIIAEPTEEMLKAFQSDLDRLLSPPRLIPMFTREIRCFQMIDPLEAALRYMKQNDYSQIVIQQSNDLDILTVEGIAKWLEEEVDNDLISLKDAHVSDASRFESPRAFIVLSRNKTIYDARKAFASAIEYKHPRLFAVVITETGKRSEKPLGIVTPWDLVN